MTATKTKRARAAGRAHRHTAIQTIVTNHQGIIDDIASIDNSIAALQNETCDIGTKLVVWTARLEEQNELNQEITLLWAEVDDTNRRIFQLAWITVGLWAIAALTIFAYLITTH